MTHGGDAPLRPRFVGELAQLTDADRRAVLERGGSPEDPTLVARVRAIVARVRSEGDGALLALTRELDGASLERLEVAPEVVRRAPDGLPREVVAALERAARNIETVHRAFLPVALEVESEPGVTVGRRPDPLAAVGVYAPGGRAVYPSSVLMGVVPARVAGVAEIAVVSPPGPSGAPSPVVLAAAAIAGATRVFAVGGAQAIAALAFGTASVPKVDRIVGPGNAYVAQAKREIAGFVGIDAPAGPSEILILADRHARAETVVRELLAQAEHDPEASVVAVVEGPELAEQTTALLAEAEPARREIVARALSSRGAVLWVSELKMALPFARDYAAEHLLVATRDPTSWLGELRHAGTVFLGEAASVAFGDYLTGANHVLPTAGLARSFSGLSSNDFVRWTTWQRVTPEAARRMRDDTARLAEAEGLPAHAAAARDAGRPGSEGEE